MTAKAASRRPLLRWGPVIFAVIVVGAAVSAGIGYLVVSMYTARDGENNVNFSSTTTPSPFVAEGACVPRDFGFGSIVCVCNATYCDALPRVTREEEGKAVVYTSTKKGLRFDKQVLSFVEATTDAFQTLTVHRDKTFQTVYGFGGGFTDSTGINILSLPDGAQNLLLRSYFSEDGLEYTLGRLPIGGTDFSTREYSYNDGEEDKSLANFKLQPEDLLYKIPMIERAKAVMPADSPDLRLFSSIWSPPTWMKTSGKYSGFGFLKKEFFQSYADYFIRFLEAYEAAGIKVDTVSTGNEPMNGVIPFKHFNALGWTPDNMHEWIRDHFGPSIRGSKFKDIKIVAHDDQRILLPWMMELVLADNATSDYIDIIGYHWYLNFITPSLILDSLHERYPDKPIINTEACNGDKPWDFTRVQLGSWQRGEFYIDDIVEVMNHWTAGWIDWNMALDRQGGPTWAKNYVDAPIIVDSHAGEFYRNPTFYALAHVTKFVPRGSVRVDLRSHGGPWVGGKVGHIAFLRPDNGLVVILVNKHSSSHLVTIREDSHGQVSFDVPAQSFVSVVYW